MQPQLNETSLKKPKQSATQAYEEITQAILQKLASGTAPWRKPWESQSAMLGEAKNLTTQKPYNGVNAILTAMQGYESPYWLTEKQANQLGGKLKDGQFATRICHFQPYSRKGKAITNPTTGEAESTGTWGGYLKTFAVYNVDQFENLPERINPSILYPNRSKAQLTPIQKIEECEKIMKGFTGAPKVTYHLSRACYFPQIDVINMPKPELFAKATDYYATLWHEFGHSTGHPSRLSRKTLMDYNPFGSSNYSKEELVAEMTSAFLCAHAGIDGATLDSSASYIAGWLKVLRNDPKMIVSAASQAQKAANFILGKTDKHSYKSNSK